MQVSAQYAFSHFEDVASAVDRGESVEILRPGKLALRLVARSASEVSGMPVLKNGRRVLGLGRGEMRVLTEDEWKAMDEELLTLMNDGPLFPDER